MACCQVIQYNKIEHAAAVCMVSLKLGIQLFNFVFKCVSMTVSILISGGGSKGLHTLGYSADFQINSLSHYLFSH